MRTAILRVEVPADVYVRVDAAGHERAVAEVDVGALRMLVDPDDQTLVDDDRGIRVLMAAPVEHACGADDERLCGGGQGDCGEEGEDRVAHGASVLSVRCESRAVGCVRRQMADVCTAPCSEDVVNT